MKGPDPPHMTEDQPMGHPLLGSESRARMKEMLVHALYLPRLCC